MWSGFPGSLVYQWRLQPCEGSLMALRSRGYFTGKMDKATSTRTWRPCVYSGLTLEAAGIRRRLNC